MKDDANLSETNYMIGEKPPIPIVSQRDAVLKAYLRHAYVEQPMTHLFARHSVQIDEAKYPDYKQTEAGWTSGYQRLIQHCFG